MKKILFDLVSFPDFGGITTVTNLIIGELLKHNFQITVLSHRKPIRRLEIQSKIQVFQVPNTENLTAKENQKYFEYLLQSNQFDYLIYQDSYAPIEKIICPLALKYGIKLYIFEHNSPYYIYAADKLSPFFSPKGFLRRLMQPYFIFRARKRKQYLYTYCNKYILLSKNYIDEFIHFSKLKKDYSKLLFINNPIDICKATTISTSSKSNIILFVGRLVREKCVDKMLFVWEQLSKVLPNWEFIIIGDGPERVICESIALNRKLKNVFFHGFTDPKPYYAKAKIFWMMSKYEGWPMTLIESMLYSCIPIVFDSFSSLSDIVEQKVNGFIVSNENIAEFKNRTLELAKNKHLYRIMSENANKSVYKFDTSKIINKWLELLK